MSNIIRLDDGTREYIIENNYGEEICKLHFRPSDISLVDRWQRMRDEFLDAIKPLESIDINADGTAATDAGINALREADQNLRAAFGELLDSKDIGDIFRTRSPFSSVGGQFFCERVTDMLNGIISGVLAEEAEASRKRTAKYIETEDSNAAGQPAADA